ncbi:MAG: hypothetical protein AAF449_13045 [Myxococcota bacterium]
MKTKEHLGLLLLTLLSFTGLACGGDETRVTNMDGGVAVDGGSCVPANCADFTGCGTFDDGCGSMVSCTQGCECTDDNFDVTCPQRPCETLRGCNQGLCVYEPVSCEGIACGLSTCTGDGCDVVCADPGCSDGLYPCGGGTCSGVNQYCDPSPIVSDGVVTYQNVCVGPPSQGCGTCGLGDLGCDVDNDVFTCIDPIIPVLDEGGVVECDSTVAASTFLFVDADYTGSADGSRERPFTTYDDALEAALIRNARGIVVGGAPVFTTPLRVADGISIYGGYGNAPDFDPAPEARPVWRVGSDHYNASSNQLVGALARSVTRATVISHLRIETTDIDHLNNGKAGATNIALLARGANALHIQDVELEAGAAGHGVAGAPGQNPSATMNGRPASGRIPGAVGPACAPLSCTLSLPYQIARQDSDRCGYGAYGAAPGFRWFAPNRGNAGASNGQATGGMPGANSGRPNEGCNSDFNATTPGQPGRNGQPGSAGAIGRAGTRGTLTADGIWNPGDGTSGTAGRPGTWGGGGGAGGGLYDDCFNMPRYGGHGGGGGGPGCGGVPRQTEIIK